MQFQVNGRCEEVCVRNHTQHFLEAAKEDGEGTSRLLPQPCDSQLSVTKSVTLPEAVRNPHCCPWASKNTATEGLLPVRHQHSPRPGVQGDIYKPLFSFGFCNGTCGSLIGKGKENVTSTLLSLFPTFPSSTVKNADPIPQSAARNFSL